MQGFQEPVDKAAEMDVEPDDVVLVPGHRNFVIYCDETGMNGTPYYGYGSLWMPAEKRADLAALVKTLRDRHGYRYEIKWQKVKKQSLGFYLDLVEAFFEREWLMFHALIIRVGYTDPSFHKDFDEEKRKRFGMLLKSKIRYFCAGDERKSYHVRVDPLPSRYAKADEAALIIASHALKKEVGLEPLKSLVTHASHRSPGIQLADVLLGASLSEWQEDASAEAKIAVRRAIGEHLGWSDLRADTSHSDWKFNLWYFYDPTGKTPREVKTRPVKLKIPMPDFSPRSK